MSFLLLSLVAGALAVWLIDDYRLRAAARRIDRHYQRLRREPKWSPMEDALQLGVSLKERLDAADAVFGQLGFKSLTRLVESYEDGTVLGARTVWVGEHGTVAGTFACSHLNPAISFRGFIAETADTIFLASDAKTASERPPNHVAKQFSKEDSESVMLREMRGMVGASAGALRAIDSTARYIELQTRLWREADGLRTKQGFIVQLDSLKKLAPATMSEARLKRVHRYIQALHSKR